MAKKKKATQAFSDIKEYLADRNPDAILLDGLEECIIGVGIANNELVAVYDERKIIQHFMSEGMTEEEAVEYYEYNTVRALPYMGKYAPILFTCYEDLGLR